MSTLVKLEHKAAKQKAAIDALQKKIKELHCNNALRAQTQIAIAAAIAAGTIERQSGKKHESNSC